MKINKKYALFFLTVASITSSDLTELFKQQQPLFAISFNESMGYIEGKNNLAKRRLAPQEAQAFYDFLNTLYARNNPTIKLPRLDQPRIPKIIHQIWLGPNTPPSNAQHCQDSIKQLHPNWEYKLWTDKDIEEFGLTNKKYYDLSRNYGERADIARYEILYRIGGVYIDVDFELLQPLDLLHHTYDFYTVLLPLDCLGMLANGLIAACPGHPILKHCIETIEDDWAQYNNILQRVGPEHFQKSFWVIGEHNSNNIIALPSSFFFPFNHTQALAGITQGQIYASIKPETFGIHYWAGSWAKANVKN